jgi:hypothetical protein
MYINCTNRDTTYINITGITEIDTTETELAFKCQYHDIPDCIINPECDPIPETIRYISAQVFHQICDITITNNPVVIADSLVVTKNLYLEGIPKDTATYQLYYDDVTNEVSYAAKSIGIIDTNFVRSITVSNGLSSDFNPITQYGSIWLATPSSITGTSTNMVGIGTHTHELSFAGQGVGSMLYYNKTTLHWTALDIGSTNQVLTTIGSTPTWADLPVSDTCLWKIEKDTIPGDYSSDYSDDYLLASLGGNIIVNKDSYNVKTTNDLNVGGQITEDNIPLSRWRGVLPSAPTIDVQEGDLYYNSTTTKVCIRANSNWQILN